ncbi:hypothetical protein GGR56DRAFT_640187 [Xylariaceae sp. FL0804]|nr:hypothetical protein GGR56DRAFT_640187 [Xylariaceae sp. FL0804]
MQWINRHAARPSEAEAPPLAIHLLENPGLVAPQPRSPLFAMPAELRDKIWSFALALHADPEKKLFPIQERYARPGQAGPLRVSAALLRTCRAVYVEAFLVPLRVNQPVIYAGDPRDLPPGCVLHRTVYGWDGMPAKLKSWQFANLTSAELVVQQFQLEDNALEQASRYMGAKQRHQGYRVDGLSRQGSPSWFSLQKPTKGHESPPPHDVLTTKKITRLRIRLSRSDLWAWAEPPPSSATRGPGDPSRALRLEPMAVHTNPSGDEHYGRAQNAMTAAHEVRRAGRRPDAVLGPAERRRCWGRQIREHWPDLQTLELELESWERKEGQLDAVVECARLWRFPLPDGCCLEFAGASTTCWRGAMNYRHWDTQGWWMKRTSNEADAKLRANPLVYWRPRDGSERETYVGETFVVKIIVFKRRVNDPRAPEI